MTTPLAVLARVRAQRPEPAAGDRCELCGAPVATTHQHVVALSTRSLLCACRPCYLLFTDADAQLAYRAVPDRYLALDLPPTFWDELELPVGTAFLLVSSAVQRVVAFYPGPAGATESELDLAAWDRVASQVPAVATLRPDVEAVLLHQGVEAFVVPVDACYELVGSLRLLWRGFDGGHEAHERLTAFFDEVRARARPA